MVFSVLLWGTTEIVHKMSFDVSFEFFTAIMLRGWPRFGREKSEIKRGPLSKAKRKGIKPGETFYNMIYVLI